MSTTTRLLLFAGVLLGSYSLLHGCISLPIDIARANRRARHEAWLQWEHPGQKRREGRGGIDRGWSPERERAWLDSRGITALGTPKEEYREVSDR